MGVASCSGLAARPRGGLRPDGSASDWGFAGSSSVIILQIYVDRVLPFESEGQAPISGHGNRIRAFAVAFERVEPVAGQLHVERRRRSVQPVQQPLDPRRELRRNAAVVALSEKTLQASMPEGLDHG